MLQMLKELTPAERASLKDPSFITEDEADLIVCDRRSHEGTVPAENVLAELVIPFTDEKCERLDGRAHHIRPAGISTAGGRATTGCG
jgi:hypothetical protein